MASTKLTRTFGSGGSRVKWTWSGWIKRTKIGVEQIIFCAYENSNNQTQCKFDSSDQLYFNDESSGNTNGRIVSNAKYRDTNAWYHMVFVWDKNNSTSADRIKMYVNGERVTSFSDTGNAPSDTSAMNNDSLGREHEIGVKNGSNDYFDGCMSHIHFCDGYAYTPTDFGETDSTTGEWKIKTSPSVSYGTTGYWILKDGNTVTDSSANSNTWTIGGTLTETKDNPSNVFATLNPLVRHQGTLDLGNTRFGTTGSWRGIPATIGLSKGKWYWEFKQVVQTNWSQNGIMSSKENGGYTGIYSTYVGNNSGGLALNSGNGDFYHDGSSNPYSAGTWFSGGLSAGDIISVALDVDASKIWFAKNGTWGNSSNPATGSNGIDFSGDTSFTSHKPYFPACSVDQCECAYNFGNGYFGTTAVATNSGNGYSDADGKAKFNYEVPTNFKAITTRGLNL
tara:strand:+ start:345 stop:1694 length:1350 start_codon:yes stop_codon:yes gene_type:complete